MATMAATNNTTVTEAGIEPQAREAILQQLIDQEETAEFVYADGLIWADRKRMSGAPCFYGTRVPVDALFTNLAGGLSLEEFCEQFGSVTLEQAADVLEYCGQHMPDPLKPWREEVSEIWRSNSKPLGFRSLSRDPVSVNGNGTGDK